MGYNHYIRLHHWDIAKNRREIRRFAKNHRDCKSYLMVAFIYLDS